MEKLLVSIEREIKTIKKDPSLKKTRDELKEYKKYLISDEKWENLSDTELGNYELVNLPEIDFYGLVPSTIYPEIMAIKAQYIESVRDVSYQTEPMKEFIDEEIEPLADEYAEKFNKIKIFEQENITVLNEAFAWARGLYCSGMANEFFEEQGIFFATIKKYARSVGEDNANLIFVFITDLLKFICMENGNLTDVAEKIVDAIDIAFDKDIAAWKVFDYKWRKKIDTKWDSLTEDVKAELLSQKGFYGLYKDVGVVKLKKTLFNYGHIMKDLKKMKLTVEETSFGCLLTDKNDVLIGTFCDKMDLVCTIFLHYHGEVYFYVDAMKRKNTLRICPKCKKKMLLSPKQVWCWFCGADVK